MVTPKLNAPKPPPTAPSARKKATTTEIAQPKTTTTNSTAKTASNSVKNRKYKPQLHDTAPHLMHALDLLSCQTSYY